MDEEQLEAGFNLLRNGILPDAKKQPDRYLAIVMCAVIEENLADIVKNRLVDHKKTRDKLFKYPGPLSNFSAQIDLGYMIGMYPDHFTRMLHSLRNIRNKFAHDMRPLDFEMLEIKSEMSGLKYIESFSPRAKMYSGRNLFISACEYIIGGLSALESDKRRFKSPQVGDKASGAPT
jgi:hypothetical protein